MSQAPQPPTTLSPHILLAHGGGGRLTDDLLRTRILPAIDNDLLRQMLDSAVLPWPGGRLALTLDSYVVQPLEFPGGDIGQLAVCGTVNDLAVCGAKPIGLALGIIAGEGLEQTTLERIMQSLGATARGIGVPIVTGDTKVIGAEGRGGLMLTTAGVGVVPADRDLHPRRVRPGDVLLINGTLAEHGLAVMLARQFPQMESVIRSDVAAVHDLVESLLATVGVENVAFLRDPTRAGLAGLACDLAHQAQVRVVLEERCIPVQPAVRHASEMLGLDVLEVANEGKVVAVVRAETAEAALNAWRRHPLGRAAACIGVIEAATEPSQARCELRTAIGGRRIVSKPLGEQLPRIC